MSSSLNQSETIQRKSLIRYMLNYLINRDIAVIQADYAAYDPPTLVGRFRPDVIGRTESRKYVIGAACTSFEELRTENSQEQLREFALAPLDFSEIEHFYLVVPQTCRPEALRLLRSMGVYGRHLEVIGVSFTAPLLLPTQARC